eukprot:gene1766-2913_t
MEPVQALGGTRRRRSRDHATGRRRGSRKGSPCGSCRGSDLDVQAPMDRSDPGPSSISSSTTTTTTTSTSTCTSSKGSVDRDAGSEDCPAKLLTQQVELSHAAPSEGGAPLQGPSPSSAVMRDVLSAFNQTRGSPDEPSKVLAEQSTRPGNTSQQPANSGPPSWNAAAEQMRHRLTQEPTACAETSDKGQPESEVICLSDDSDGHDPNCKTGVRRVGRGNFTSRCALTGGPSKWSPSDIQRTMATVKKNKTVIEHERRLCIQDSVQGKTRLDLRCPLGLTLIKTPVRGRQCMHLQCWDLSTYLQFYAKADRFYNHSHRWRCPVCDEPAPPDELQFSVFVVELIQQEAHALHRRTVYLGKDM